ncbi:MAG TPA: DUF1850 domain-containing protein [Albitalea sp.]|uniref:DUF1850 domain-containing protein n=1 Tax=Piscinibacter sp. TaxID=1903157 RepID=UPI002ED188C5
MDICLAAGLATTLLLRAPSPITLSWEHSVEHFQIEEEWQAQPAGLVLAETRSRGLGAGVALPDDARLADGWWRFRPALPPQPQVRLANSSFGAGYRWCAQGRCQWLPAGLSLTMSVCPEDPR